MEMGDEKNQVCCETSTQPQPLKKFNECVLEEKISRLHSELVDTRRGLDWAYRNNNALQRKIESLEKHYHLTSGECVIKIQDFRNDNTGCGILQKLDLLA